MEHHLHDLSFAHQVGIIDQIAVDMDLLERFGMHEIAAQIVFVKVLVGTTFHANRFDLLAGRERFVEHAPVFEVSQFGADEGRAFAGFYVQEFDDRKRFTVQFDAHSVFDICCRCHCIELF